MKNNLTVSIIIPNWNGARLLEKNLGPVLKAKENKENQILEIIVVDDKSTDASVALLEKKYKDKIRLIKHTQNRGFASAVNNGVRMAKGDLVCLLNTDVAPENDFLVRVIPHFQNPRVFGISLNEKGPFRQTRGVFEKGFVVHQPGKKTKGTQQTFWVSGGSGVFKRSLWLKLKGLDEKLFAPFYWEDLDLSYRALKRGYLLLWEPEAEVIHEHESTINLSNFRKGYLERIKERNQLLFIWKNLTSKSLFKKHLRGLLSRAFRHPGYLIVILKALGKLKRVIIARKKEKKESKISDETIFARF